MTKGWKDWIARVGFTWALAAALAGPIAVWTAPLSAADSNMPMAAEDAAKERLARLLAGRETPTTVDDLRMIQQRVHELTDKLISATVGVQVGHAWGSGVIISKDGFVLTAAHVSGQPGRDVRFMMSDGRILKGRTLGLFRTFDAGLMKITDEGEFPAAEMAPEDPSEGRWCLATGHPGGYQEDRKPVLRMGRVLLKSNNALTTDCTLVGGDSGGPLFDMEGRVIGINSRIGGKLTSNMHVPVSTYRVNWDRMLKEEAWGHLEGHAPYIGVRGEAEVAEAKIASVVPNSPAEKVGLKSGDVIVTCDGRSIASFEAFKDFIKEHQPGETIKLQVRRGEEMMDFNVKLVRQRG